MSKLIRLTSELRDDFVAYLDGELDEEATERIEKVIAQSEVARSDLEALAKTYELLDSLERPEAPSGFAERTMATIRVDELRADPRDTWWYRLSRQGGVFALWAMAVVAATTLGYVAANRWYRAPSDDLVDNLPLIEHLDLYTEVGSIEFLERLSSQGGLLQEIRPETEEAAAP